MSGNGARNEHRTVQDEFALRYYRWSLLDSQRELASGFPFVRTVRSSLSTLFLEFGDGEGREVLRDFMTGGIKRFNPRGAELAGDVISEDERAAHQRFLKFMTPEIERQGQRLSSLRVSSQEFEIRERELRGETTLRLKKRQFIRLIEAALEQPFGAPDKALSNGLHYCLPVGPWFAMTDIDLSGRAQLSYSHQISARPTIDLRPDHLMAGISLLAWCGIHQATRFDLIEESQMAEAAQAIGAICAHFLAHLPSLLDGLEQPS